MFLEENTRKEFSQKRDMQLKVCHPVYHCFETDLMAASQDGRRVRLRKVVKKGYSG